MNHLKYFFEVAKARSFTGAARKLKISQPGVSRTIGNLEAEMGIKLFDRDRRNVRLTDAGRRFYERCKLIFNEFENLKSVATDFREECSGDLRIGASDNICNYVLPKLMKDFCKKHPKVNFKIYSGASGEIKESILRAKSEIGIFYTPLIASEREVLEVRELGSVEFALIVSSREKRVGKVFNRAEFVNGLRYIGSRQSDYKQQFPALKMHQLLGLEPKSFIGTNNQEMQKRLVIEGAGYSIVPAHMVNEEVTRGLLRVIPTDTPLRSPVYLVKPKGRELAKPARLFVEAVVQKGTFDKHV